MHMELAERMGKKITLVASTPYQTRPQLPSSAPHLLELVNKLGPGLCVCESVLSERVRLYVGRVGWGKQGQLTKK